VLSVEDYRWVFELGTVQIHCLSDRPRSVAPALVDPWEVP
jgi:hypothetical protein